MLYDPRWDHRDVLTIENLIAWLETQDPDTRYWYVNPMDCLVARFLKHMGVSKVALSPDELPPEINRALWIANMEHQTYGNALKRLRRAR